MEPSSAGLITDGRNESRFTPSDPVFSGLADAQKTLVARVREGEAMDWWKVAVLDDALQKQNRSWSKRYRQTAFERIRKGAAPGWLYKSMGKRSAYFLELFQAEPSLPKEFRATAHDLKRADDARLRSRILQTIAMAVEDYRAVRSRDPVETAEMPPLRNAKEGARWMKARAEQHEDDLRRLLEPYVEAVDSMIATTIPDPLNEIRWKRWLLLRSRVHDELALRAVRGDKAPDVLVDLARFQEARLAYRWLLSVGTHFQS